MKFSWEKHSLVIAIAALVINITFLVFATSLSFNSEKTHVTSRVIDSVDLQYTDDVPTTDWVSSDFSLTDIPLVSSTVYEATSSRLFEEPNYLYAIKEKYTVSVFRHNLNSGKEQKIFTYDEVALADLNSGNHWQSLPPSVALSKEKNLIAFVDKDGLATFDLSTNVTERLIKKVGERTLFNEPGWPAWSVDVLNKEKNSVFSFYAPRWSPDGRQISFIQSHYEGSSHGLFDLAQNTYLPIKTDKNSFVSGSQSMRWLTQSERTVIPGRGGMAILGLYVSDADDMSTLRDIGGRFERNKKEFYEVDTSPTEDRIVFTFKEDWRDSTTTLAVTDGDGNHFEIFDAGNRQFLPTYSPDGKFIFYVHEQDGTFLLAKIGLTAKQRTFLTVLPAIFSKWSDMQWTKDGHLAIRGSFSNSATSFSQIFIFDPTDSSLIYQSPQLGYFTSLLGFDAVPVRVKRVRRPLRYSLRNEPGYEQTLLYEEDDGTKIIVLEKILGKVPEFSTSSIAFTLRVVGEPVGGDTIYLINTAGCECGGDMWSFNTKTKEFKKTDFNLVYGGWGLSPDYRYIAKFGLDGWNTLHVIDLVSGEEQIIGQLDSKNYTYQAGVSELDGRPYGNFDWYDNNIIGAAVFSVDGSMDGGNFRKQQFVNYVTVE